MERRRAIRRRERTKGVRILWVSRHKPLASQVQELRRIFGDDCFIILSPQEYASVKTVLNRFSRHQADEMVLVAPITVYQEVLAKGIKPLWAHMRRTGGDNSHYEFVGFTRVHNIKIEMEKL